MEPVSARDLVRLDNRKCCGTIRAPSPGSRLVSWRSTQVS